MASIFAPPSRRPLLGAVALSTLSLFLGGCVGPLVPVRTPESTGGSTFEAGFRLRVVDPVEASKMQRLGPVEGYSCKNKIWDPAATAEAATVQLKVSAAQRGATAISNLVCAESGTSLVTNCWQSYKCTGEALR